MEWIIDSAKKDKSTGKKKANKPGDDDKDLDDEETFTKGETNICLSLFVCCNGLYYMVLWF